ncbi:MAG TPA: sterol desaturase family protein [Chthoniobacterales bacterium]|nr:sterol desaturase family protein [Chthoniobacterales bacterium]
MPKHRLCIFVVIPGLSFLVGQSAAAPTIPLPQPGNELGLLPALVILGLFTTVAAAELIRPLRTRSGATSRRWVGNLSLCILSNGVFVLPTITAFAAAFVSQSEQKSLLDMFELPSTMRFVVAIIGLDALAYAQHRLLHRVDVLWRFHAVHHSDPEVDVTTTFRHHPVEAIFSGALIGSVVLVIGFSPAEIAAYTWVSFLVELVAHANLALPSWFGAILGRLIVTPEFHHLHHSRAKAEANANFGLAFSIWDTLFGTAQARSPQDSRRLEFGLEEFRGQKFHLPHYLLAQPLLRRTTEPTVTAASRS